MFRAFILPIFRSARLCVAACGIMHPRLYRPATSWVQYTTSWNTQSSAPEGGQNNCPKHVELIEIINKTVIVASSWLSILFISIMHGQANIKSISVCTEKWTLCSNCHIQPWSNFLAYKIMLCRICRYVTVLTIFIFDVNELYIFATKQG